MAISKYEKRFSRKHFLGLLLVLFLRDLMDSWEYYCTNVQARRQRVMFSEIRPVSRCCEHGPTLVIPFYPVVIFRVPLLEYRYFFPPSPLL